MMCGITHLLDAREITVGVYNNFNENQNTVNKGNNKITELRTILQRESQNS